VHASEREAWSTQRLVGGGLEWLVGLGWCRAISAASWDGRQPAYQARGGAPQRSQRKAPADQRESGINDYSTTLEKDVQAVAGPIRSSDNSWWVSDQRS
jgi:hypothetical protein